MKSSIPGKFKPLIVLITGALLIGAAPAALAADARLPSGFPGDTTADAVLGQQDFIHRTKNFVDGHGLDISISIVSDVAIDKSVSPNSVYVVDTNNHRVLGWKDISNFAKHLAADIVIGQPDFFSNACNVTGITRTSLCTPMGAAVDSAGNLFVADHDNHRVLYYKTPFSTDTAADDVFGQFGSFNTNFCDNSGIISQSTLCGPIRLTLDVAGNLYVSDQGNNRVLEYNSPEAITATAGSGDTTADLVFGQFDGFNSGSCNTGGSASAQSLCNPVGLATDSAKNLYVADFSNNRVLKYNTPVLTTDTTADKVYGQLGIFTTNVCNNGGINAKSLCFPMSVAIDPAGAVYISERGNHRVLAYPATGATTANKVLGQFGSFSTNFCNTTGGTTNPPVNFKSLCNPDGLAFDTSVSPNSPNLYVSDTGNNRVLQYKPTGTPSTIKNGQGASSVLGQYLLTINFSDALDGLGFAMSDANAGTVAIDRSVTPNRIYVSDYPNHRVLAWNTIAAFTSHAPATLVFGQPNPFTNTANNGGISNKSLNHPRGLVVDPAGNLFIADQDNHRVLEYDTPFTAGTAADRVFGQSGSFATAFCNQPGTNADSLCVPVGLALDSAKNLYVADFNNNRVLKYNTPLTAGTTADKVYGQQNNLTSAACNLGGVTANSLCNPHGLAVDSGDNLYVTDLTNNRVLEYNKLPVTNTTANNVFGQGDVTTNACNSSGLNPNSLCRPRFVTANTTGAIYIADTDNHRVLKYNAPLTTDRKADKVFGQGNLFTTNGCKPVSPNTLCFPDGVAIDKANNLYIGDSNNNRVLQFLNP